MDKLYIEFILKKIKTLADKGDYEGAHSLEDKLYHEFISALCQTEDIDPYHVRALGQKVLESKDIDFVRHCS